MADTNMNSTEELESSGYEHLVDSGQALEDPYDFVPRVVTQTPGAMEDIQQKLRIGGMALRKHYNESLKKNPEKWKALRAPASMQSTQRTLAEMMLSIPDVDRTQFHEMGDGSVMMPPAMMEKYLYPALYLRDYLQDKADRNVPGGIDMMIVYSFFLQGSIMPRNRTAHDLEALRSTAFSANYDTPAQLQTSAEVVDGLSSHLRSTLRRLQKATLLPDYGNLADLDQDKLELRQSEIDTLIKLYTDQITRDYNAFRLQKEQLVLLSHLSQQQSIEVLEVNLRLQQALETTQIRLQKHTEDELLNNYGEMEKHLQMMLDRNRKAISASLREAAEGITPYDVHDMRNVLESQKKMMDDLLAKNALLVTENSQLRMHLSFVPVEYRDYISNLQATNDPIYRNQRRTPRVIIPDTFHKRTSGNFIGSEILLEDAPMAHPSVIKMFCDAQYETLSSAKQQMDRGFALRARITTDAATKVIPKAEVPWQRLHSDVPDVQSQAPAPYTLSKPEQSRGKGKHVLSQLANRRQPPQKMSRYEPTQPPTPPPMGGASAPARSAGGIPLPPTPNGDAFESSSVMPPPAVQPRAALTPGQAGVPSYTGRTIMPLTRAEARKHYKALVPTTMPKENELLADEVLARILTKLPHEGDPHVNDFDRNMSDFMINQINSCFTQAEHFIYEVMSGTKKLLLDVYGNLIPYERNAYDASNQPYLHRLLPLKEIARVGDYYHCLRQRPEKKGSAYEYIPNLTYRYKDVKRTLKQINIHVLPSRMWDELPLSTTTDQQLHPYIEWCPGKTLDFAAMESTLGIDHIPYGSETVYQAPKAAPAPSAKAPRKLQDHRLTVERLYELGVINTQAQPELLELKAIFDDQIKVATDELQRIPFAISQRILNVYINRWTAIARALDVITKPYNPYGKSIVNAPFEPDERKRKADKSSLTASSPSVKATDEERQDDDMDRLNPEGGGGNSV